MTKEQAVSIFSSSGKRDGYKILAGLLKISRQAIYMWPDGELEECRASQIRVIAAERGLIPPIGKKE